MGTTCAHVEVLCRSPLSMGTVNQEEDEGGAERAEGQVISLLFVRSSGRPAETSVTALTPTEPTKPSLRPRLSSPLSCLLMQERTGKQEDF